MHLFNRNIYEQVTNPPLQKAWHAKSASYS